MHSNLRHYAENLKKFFHVAQKPGVSVTPNPDRPIEVLMGTDLKVFCESTGEYKGVATWYKKTARGTRVCI